MLTSRLLWAVGIVGMFCGIAVAGQSPASPAFEVASVKPSPSVGGPTGSLIELGGRYTATNMSLLALIRTAYRLQRNQLVGTPSWVGSEHFDIVAKADRDLIPSSVTSDAPRPLELALRGLLADRFHFVAHQETRQLPIYALVVSRSDGRLGPNLEHSTTDCAAVIAAERAGASSPPTKPGHAPPCEARAGIGRLSADTVTLSQL